MNEIKTSRHFNHPIFNPMWLKFNTPMVKNLRAKLMQWVYCGIKGGVILADSRTGKTTAIEMIKDCLKTRDGSQSIQSHMMIMGGYDKRTILNCYREIYSSTGNTLRTTQNVNKLVEQIVHFLGDIAATNNDRIVILFVDEFHLLTIKEMEAFAKIHNELRQQKVTLYTYFIGSTEEGMLLIEKSNDKTKSHIRGRFFKNKYYFLGIENKADLRLCLKEYDKCRYPGDGPTYTEFFLPKEYEEGWRLESITDELWEYYKDLKGELDLRSWGMEYFVGAVNPLLADYLPKYGVEEFNRSMFLRCIDVSGLVPDYLDGLS